MVYLPFYPIQNLAPQFMRHDLVIAEKFDFQTVFEICPVGMAVVDGEFRFIQVNKTFSDMMGYHEQGLINLPLNDILHPEDFLKIPVSGAKRKDVLFPLLNLELRFIPKDSRLLSCAVTITVLEDVEGTIKKYLITVNTPINPILEEDAAGKNEEKYRMLVENMGEGIGIMDSDEIFVFANSSGEKIFGVEEGKLKGTCLKDFIIEEDLGHIIKETKKRSHGESSTYELRIRLRNGVIKDLLITATPIFEGKKFIGTLGVYRDYTQIKLIEKDLKEQRERLENVIEGTNTGTWQLNMETGEVIINERWAEMIGYEMQELTPLSRISIEKLIHPEDVKIVQSELAKVFENSHLYLDVSYRIKHRNGYWIWAHDRGKVFERTADGKPRSMAGTHGDITEQVRTEAVIKENTARLHELNATKDKFFSIIAHDLKNNFISFKGLLNLLVNDYRKYDSEGIEEMLVLLSEHSKNTYLLLENLLIWAGSQSGRIENKPVKLSIKDLLGENCSLLKGQAESKLQELAVEAMDQCIIYSDQFMINTILRNLISNAIKFTPHKGKIVVSASRFNGHIEVKVSDNGVGISEAKQDTIFRIDTKSSTPGTDMESGTGLGLILCKEFVEKNGGKIRVESTVGKGSSFIFTLPLFF
jgi:PAS domain S-box-containing protein